MLKATAHNLNEVKALIKESFSKGNEDDFNCTRWYTHDGKFICLSSVSLVEFTLHLDTKSSVTIEV